MLIYPYRCHSPTQPAPASDQEGALKKKLRLPKVCMFKAKDSVCPAPNADANVDAD